MPGGAGVGLSALPPPQAAFAAALLDPDQPCPEGLRTWNGSDPTARFAVYRNNVVTSLVGALADTYPVVRELVGADFFHAMARVHVAQAPPRSKLLRVYGEAFPEFIAGFRPAQSLPYLADVARLEWQRVCSFHAADDITLGAADIAPHLAQPEALVGSLLRFHPSAAVLASRWAVVDLWAAHQDAGDLAGVVPDQAQCALVLRHDESVSVVAIDAGSADCFATLMAGDTLGAACAGAAASHADFDVSTSLGLLIRHGALSAWHLPGSP